MTAQKITERDHLSLRIGAAEERIRHILRDLTEDEAVLLLLHDGTPPPDAGWASEDECAAFVACAQRTVTEMWAGLDGLYAELEALLTAEAAVA